MMKYFKDKNTGEVHAYDDVQLFFVDRINTPDFDNEKEQIPDVYFEINERIKGQSEMTETEVEAHINQPAP